MNEREQDRLERLDRIKQRLPEIKLEQHELDWRRLEDGHEALLVDGGGIDGGKGAFLANACGCPCMGLNVQNTLRFGQHRVVAELVFRDLPAAHCATAPAKNALIQLLPQGRTNALHPPVGRGIGGWICPGIFGSD